jgi:hypothetical protein
LSMQIAIFVEPNLNEMNYFIYPYLLLTSCLFFYGCGHQCACNQTAIKFSFVGYANSEIDSIKLVKFKPGSQFGAPIDSILLTSANSYTSAHSDTLDFYATLSTTADNNNFTITNGYDWEIINLFDNKLIRISNIQTSERTMHCGGIQLVLNDRVCYSPITSFLANGVTTTPVNTTGEVWYYINK